MPAKAKTGFKYLPVYHDLFSSKKIVKAEDLIDPSGEDLTARILVDKFLIRVYSAIFRAGYFLFWDDKAKHKLCSEIGNGVTIIKLDKYINAFFGANLLSRDIYDKYGILTNKGIQEEWLNISITYFRRKKAYIISEYSLLSSENTDDSSEQSMRSLGKKDVNLGKKQEKNKKDAGQQKKTVDCSEESIDCSEESIKSSEQMVINAEEAFNSSTILNTGIDIKGNTRGIINNINDNDEIGFSEEIADSSEQSTDTLGRIPVLFPKNENSGINQTLSSEKPIDSSEQSTKNSEKHPKNKKLPKLDVEGPPINSFYPIEHLLEVYFTSNGNIRTRETLAQNTYMDLELLRDWGEAFNRHLVLEGTVVKQQNDWSKHFKNWLLIQEFSKINPKNLNTEKDTNHGRSKNQPAAYTGADIKGHQPVSVQSAIGKINQLPI